MPKPKKPKFENKVNLTVENSLALEKIMYHFISQNCSLPEGMNETEYQFAENLYNSLKNYNKKFKKNDNDLE